MIFGTWKGSRCRPGVFLSKLPPTRSRSAAGNYVKYGVRGPVTRTGAHFPFFSWICLFRTRLHFVSPRVAEDTLLDLHVAGPFPRLPKNIFFAMSLKTKG